MILGPNFKLLWFNATRPMRNVKYPAMHKIQIQSDAISKLLYGIVSVHVMIFSLKLVDNLPHTCSKTIQQPLFIYCVVTTVLTIQQYRIFSM